jgi:hypothetical protein
MEEVKIGDAVQIKAKIIEIVETAKGRYYKVRVENELTFNEDVRTDPKNIVE